MKRSELDALKATIAATKAVRTRAEAAVALLHRRLAAVEDDPDVDDSTIITELTEILS